MKITGTIKDNTGQSIPFASVFFSDVNGTPTGNGVQADSNGNYSVSGNGNYITASFVGMAKQTKNVGSLTGPDYVIEFTLTPDASSTFDATAITAKKPIPWMLILWVSVAIGGTIFLILKISKDFKNGQK